MRQSPSKNQMQRRQSTGDVETDISTLYRTVEELWGRSTTNAELLTTLQSSASSLTALAVAGQVKVKRITSTDSPYQMIKAFNVIAVNTDDGDVTVTTPSGIQSAFVKIANVGSSGNNVDISGTIYGESGITLYDKETVDLHYDSTEGWF